MTGPDEGSLPGFDELTGPERDPADLRST